MRTSFEVRRSKVNVGRQWGIVGLYIVASCLLVCMLVCLSVCSRLREVDVKLSEYIGGNVSTLTPLNYNNYFWPTVNKVIYSHGTKQRNDLQILLL